jgi:cytochrome c oxidase cbb3-type subunit 3
MLATAGCEREQRQFRDLPAASAPVESARVSELVPGGERPGQEPIEGPYSENAYSVSEGKRLYSLYNCNGCHSNGGGGMGPPLIDAAWTYGSAPRNVFDTIVEGRPNGMPAWGSRVPRRQVWQLVAYVRSMSGQLPDDISPGRSDNMQAKPSETMIEQKEPLR